MDTLEDRPSGRDEVVRALIAAATALFAERGPAAVSLRDVAAEANVNLGLIHRYIGGKEDLLAATLSSRPGMSRMDAPSLRTTEELVDTLLKGVEENPAFLRVLLRAAVEGFDTRRLQARMPLVVRAAKVSREDLPRKDADVRIAFVTAALMAWHVIAPVVFAELKDRPTHEDIVHGLRPALLAFLDADESAEQPLSHA